MAYRVTKTKKESFEQLKVLIAAFEKEHAVFIAPKYGEEQLRGDFINPLLKTLGWDVDNEATKSQFLRDVIQEESIDVEEEDSIAKKYPDYTLRLQGTRKLFIEAKKASIDIENSPKAAFQTRRYGWNANLGVSILINFEKLVVYDCRYIPDADDKPAVARYSSFHFTEYLKRFDELYKLLSYESVASGYIDDIFSLAQKEGSTFDAYFLRQIEDWRHRLATDVVKNNSGFNDEDINFVIQRLLNRIIFLRICEDREIEKYETLHRITSYDELKTLFIQSDKKYNSNLFDFIEDNFALNIDLRSELLIAIFNELYYPKSPYDFSVIDPSILSQIYERYLGSKIKIESRKTISIIEEPEVAASNGVVPTPKMIVESIARESLEMVVGEKNADQIRKLRIADICCGSGTFLLSVYDYLLERIISSLIASGVTDDNVIYKSSDGSYHLTLKAKESILVDNLYGVDINPYAVEVTKFSLLLKLLEKENAGSIESYLVKYKKKILPSLEDNIKCGNSLVDDTYFKFAPEAIEDDELLYKVKPFNWEKEFPFLAESKGFDCIVGNPPYIRIQNLAKYSAEEIKFYQDEVSGYTVAESDNFDKYYLFIQRAISLLRPSGVMGYIVPNKFFIVKGGKALRKFISSGGLLTRITHFGVTQVFPNRSTYTAILVLGKQAQTEFGFRRIKNIDTELAPGKVSYEKHASGAFGENPWIFVSKATDSVFHKLKTGNVVPLKDIADITVGLQTSADKIYIIQPHSETKKTYSFTKDSIEYKVEKAICKPCLYDLSFGLFDTVAPNAQIIFPYTITGDSAEVFSEKHFRGSYPLAWAYLGKFKKELSKRSINGTKSPKWYQYGRSQSLTKFHDSVKLIWPVLSTAPSYICDKNNLQFTGGGNGPYYSLVSNSDYSPLYMLGILAHPLFETMVKAGASEFRGAYYSHGKQFIENIPIRKIDFSKADEKKKHEVIVKLVKQLIDAKAKFNQARLAAKKKVLKRKLDFLFSDLIGQINQLYKITGAEMSAVMKDEILSADVNES